MYLYRVREGDRETEGTHTRTGTGGHANTDTKVGEKD
jgi:hypothetical protein